MTKREKPTRDKQIEVMVGAEQRQNEFVRRWIAKPEVKAALHRRDEIRSRKKKIAGC